MLATKCQYILHVQAELATKEGISQVTVCSITDLRAL